MRLETSQYGVRCPPGLSASLYSVPSVSRSAVSNSPALTICATAYSLVFSQSLLALLPSLSAEAKSYAQMQHEINVRYERSVEQFGPGVNASVRCFVWTERGVRPLQCHRCFSNPSRTATVYDHRSGCQLTPPDAGSLSSRNPGATPEEKLDDNLQRDLKKVRRMDQ